MSRRKSMTPREPNGRPQRSPKDPTASPTAQARLKHAALRRMADPVWSTMLGILHLSGRLNEAQFAAGRYWSELARDYTIASSSPKYPRSVDLDPMGGSPIDPDPDSEWGSREAQQDTQTIHRYLASLAQLKLTGEVATGAVIKTCELDTFPVGEREMNGLRAGLQALANWYAKK